MALQGTQHGVGGVEEQWEESQCLQIQLQVIAGCSHFLDPALFKKTMGLEDKAGHHAPCDESGAQAGNP